MRLLRAGRSGDRIQVWGEISRTRPVRLWGPPAPYTMSTGSFPGVKRPGRGVDRQFSAEVKERVQLTSTPPLGLRGLF